MQNTVSSMWCSELCLAFAMIAAMLQRLFGSQTMYFLTEYTITMYDTKKKELRWNATYFDYAATMPDEDVKYSKNLTAVFSFSDIGHRQCIQANLFFFSIMNKLTKFWNSYLSVFSLWLNVSSLLVSGQRNL